MIVVNMYGNVYCMEILDESGDKSNKIWVDKGNNRSMKSLQDNDIKM